MGIDVNPDGSTTPTDNAVIADGVPVANVSLVPAVGAAIPEPGTLPLITVGMVIGGLTLRRRSA